jgi:hypothetical protein
MTTARKLRRLLLVPAAVLCATTAACGGMYALRTQGTAPVPKEKGIAVVVYDETAGEGGLLDKGGGPTAEHPLVAIFESNLMEEQFAVRSMDLDKIVPHDLQEHVLSPAAYTVTQDRTTPAGQGGGALVTDDSLSTLRDVGMLLDGIPESWGVDHLLVVHKLGTYSYTVEIVRVADKAVVFTFAFDGDRDGWNSYFEAPVSRPDGQDYSVDPRSSWYTYLQLAEKVCSLI